MCRVKPRQPRILLITGSMDCGGAQRALAGMADYWAAKGWDIRLLTWTGPETADFYTLSADVTRVWMYVPLTGKSRLATLRTSVARIARLRSLLRQSRPDSVISFIDVSNIYTIMAALGLGLHVVVSERTNPSVNFTVSAPWRLLRRFCYSWATQVVAQTHDAASWIERNCRTKVAIIPNSLRSLPPPADTRDDSIVAVGRLAEEKGFDVLLQSFARIHGRFPKWKLYILGEGPERLNLEALRDELALAGVVELPGQVQGVEKWLGRAGLVVHPSRREGFPNAVLEAMGMGAAVICANCHSGPAELIQDGINGRLVAVDDAFELADVMSELMAQPALREELGRRAARVRQNYHANKIMAKWEQILAPTLGQPK